MTDTDYLYDGAPPANKVELGKNLFWDKILSGYNNVSCGTCHNVENPLFTKNGSGEYVLNTLDSPGTPGQGFPEQSTYDEWLNSDYATTGVFAPQFGRNVDTVSSCKSCHIPNCPTGKPRGVKAVQPAPNVDNATAAVNCSSSVTKPTTYIEAFINGWAAERIAQDHPDWWVKLTRIAPSGIGEPKIAEPPR